MNSREKRRRISKLVGAEKPTAWKMAMNIAELAEPGFEEFRSVELLAEYLKSHGFVVEYPWKHLPTAFRAMWGKRGPRVGILAEYDALPDCGAQRGTWGHGCGHNLLGVAAAVAGVAAKGALEAAGANGRIDVWGCPAEELLAGKVYMARDGAFRDDDAILAWHPSSTNDVQRAGGAAMDSVLFEFFGKTAHGTCAEEGRSALDGVMLLDVAANYLREHVPENVRIHMCIRNGGDAPNVVPAYAKSWYYVRGKNRAQVDDVRKRLVACARGSATATGTRLKVTRLTGVYNRLENHALADAMLENLKLFGANRPTARDIRNVKKLGKKPKFDRAISTKPSTPGRASSDEDNVSWIVPMGGELRIACVSQGTPGHHRDYAAQMVLPFACAGMLRAAEVLAATAVDLCRNPKLARKARREFDQRRKGFRYDPLIGRRQKPPSTQP